VTIEDRNILKATQSPSCNLRLVTCNLSKTSDALRLSDLQKFPPASCIKKKGATPDAFSILPTFIFFLLSFIRLMKFSQTATCARVILYPPYEILSNGNLRTRSPVS